MKNFVKKTVEFLTGTKVHANYTSIKGNKSAGGADQSGYRHFRGVLHDRDNGGFN